MTGPQFSYSWRPSGFAPSVSHYAIDGQTPREYPGESGTWVWAVCGQRVYPRFPEEEGAMRCPECLAWIRGGQNAEKPPTPGPEDGPGGRGLSSR